MSKEPTSVSPCSKISFKVSTTCRFPMIPAKTPSTPPSWQLGTRPGGGGSGYKQR